MTARLKRENVMLAYPADEGRVSRLGEKFFVQPKLNGERARVEWFHGDPVLISSYGNAYRFLEHIESDIKRLSKVMGQCRFDGELYVHGWTWSQIRAIASRDVNRHPQVGELQYHIFDIQDERQSQTSRLLNLRNHFPMVHVPSLRLVETSVCGQDDWIDGCAEFVERGYEGIILRSISAPYFLKRNVCLLKFKPTEQDEYTIVEVLEAVSQEGEPKGMVGAFLVKSDDEVVFKVGAGKMSHSERTRLWQKGQNLTNSTLIVKHEKLRTVNQVPVAAVAVAVKGEIL